MTDQRPFQLGMVIVSAHHLEMFRQMRDTVYEVLIRFRFIICPLGQLLVQPFYLLFHLMVCSKACSASSRTVGVSASFICLGKITDRRLLRYADRPEVGDCKPANIFSIVDFPAPFFPTSAIRSFLFTTNETSSKA